MAESPIQTKENVEIPEGLWLRCTGCTQMIYRRILEEELHVCPDCAHHYRIDPRTRVKQLVDPGTFESRTGFGSRLGVSTPCSVSRRRSTAGRDYSANSDFRATDARNSDVARAVLFHE